MNQIIITVIFLLFTLLPAGAVKKFEANPINVAVVIVEKVDSTEIAKFFDYYGYTQQGTTDGYKIMKHPNGSEMRYLLTDSNDGSRNTKVIVKTKASHKQIDKDLTDLKFKKVGNLYERMINRYNNQVTQCSFGPSSTLVFQRFTNKNTKDYIQ